MESKSTINFHYQTNNGYNCSSLDNTKGTLNPQKLSNSSYTKNSQEQQNNQPNHNSLNNKVSWNTTQK